MKKLRTVRGILSVSLSMLVSMLFVYGTAQGATTISSNISTGGTLAVTGASTLTGDVTASADLTVTSGARIGTGSTGDHLTALAG
ncbi:MAG: hypothetical protein HYS59_01345, partial [Candidatus Vogelbacteria bacterium]|nr:hypothetical protein [Candidatus Vogelbacteria bacterium]